MVLWFHLQECSAPIAHVMIFNYIKIQDDHLYKHLTILLFFDVLTGQFRILDAMCIMDHDNDVRTVCQNCINLHFAITFSLIWPSQHTNKRQKSMRLVYGEKHLGLISCNIFQLARNSQLQYFAICIVDSWNSLGCSGLIHWSLLHVPNIQVF